MRLILNLITFLLTTGLIFGAGGALWGYRQYQAPGPLQEPVLLIVERGQGVGAIAAKLEAENVIASALLFRIVARLTDKHTEIKAGEYQFSPGVSAAEVLDRLASGAIFHRRLTVPEGLTSWQIVQLLNQTGELSGEIVEIPAEGTLLPETYLFSKGETRQEKIARMQQAMQQTLDEIWYNRPKDAPLFSIAEAVILASIVEKETALPEERRRIAGVFINRLRKGMRLQTDPTVIYALTEGKIKDEGQGPLDRRLLSADLQVESPYNTYKYAGLPPGPIANPGRESLEAVLDPEKHDYLYFVADGKGGHLFAATLEEHNRNVARWRQIRKQRGE